jgi:mitosis inhibitor protein kinase SWE1
MLTPSPLRRKALVPADSDTSAEGELGLETPIDHDDIFSQSPYRPTAPLKSFDAHLRSAAGPSRFSMNSVPVDLDDDCDDDHIFLSTPAAASTPAPKAAQQRTRVRRSERPAVPPSRTTPAAASRMRTPVKRAQPRPHSNIETSSRRRSTPPPLPRPFPIAQPHTFTPPAQNVPLPSAQQVTPVSRPNGLRVDTSKTGVKRKSTELPVTMPYRKGMLTPLAITKTSGEGSFDRLAPLSAPKFRGPTRSQEEEEGFLGGPGTMEKLCIGVDSALADPVEELMAEEAVDVSPGGHIVKRRAKSRPVSWELQHGVGGTSQVSRLGRALLFISDHRGPDTRSPRKFPKRRHRRRWHSLLPRPPRVLGRTLAHPRLPWRHPDPDSVSRTRAMCQCPAATE